MRHMGRDHVVAGVTLGALTVLLATGCSFSSGDDSVIDKEEVAREAAAQLEEQVGQEPDDLTCPEDLPAEVDASIRCELTEGGQKFGVTVTTTSVEGDNVEFDIEVDEAPMN